MIEGSISSKILGFFREKEIMKDLTEDEDFFELGVSSLTVVELQIVIEKALGLEVSTSKLMGAPTVKEWVEVYEEKARELSVEESSV
ncbi:acyl carrier protein [Aliikangiella coralliicola]|uniref:Acyl carrier protein n=1 Tax=Aliikangiella coralliicola TaxID=2592383 RepID=A0A545TV36_9GAMM|nr:acyl carrier protein [Aliikangiella coralliicola]TQV81085.1 acyl carrier protein [Aliikangiella coralliicola]